MCAAVPTTSVQKRPRYRATCEFLRGRPIGASSGDLGVVAHKSFNRFAVRSFADDRSNVCVFGPIVDPGGAFVLIGLDTVWIGDVDPVNLNRQALIW
jgi:hypothetical protein